ncbi:hypothetical protein ISF_09444 [Cordyceps fumosorosea ARSEF 2679]|uniref:Uncharacterized protein n=1 Tax=Cordyceps fumosorosea (strain ARSEF 2679) TaxID=1081104 RepID=A0A167IMH0_CORFA|nr:hypothetical protein ISF_09444 [Cordyceps fumosorosea ARSEF 2679]OAA49232.1 hypothetical protein ISF_09444 [Cordyceps fumosorosea ARSEF 2679]
MHISNAIALIVGSLSLVAAADDNVRVGRTALPQLTSTDTKQGILYTEENGGGISFKIRSSNCIRLRKPLTGAVRSISVTLFQECTLYYDRQCDSGVKHVDFYNDENKIQDPAVEAVRCADVDANCAAARDQEL